MTTMKNRIATFALALLIAFGLWVYVITVDNPEFEKTYYDIPVYFQNETALTNRGLMITSDSAPKITLRLKGNRSDLNNLNESNINIIADLSRIYDTGTQSLSYSISYPGNVPESAVTVMDKSLEYITLSVERRMEKQLDIELVYEGAVPEGYLADKSNAVLDYNTITVTGPASVVSQIDHARILVDIDGLSSTLDAAFAYTLCNQAGEPVQVPNVNLVVAQPGEVNLVLPIQQVKELTLALNVTYGGGITEENCTITIDPVTILVSGSEESLRELGDTLIIGSVDLSKQTVELEQTFEILLPPGVTNHTMVGVENVATATFSIPDLKTATFTVTNIVPTNVPSGLEFELVTKQFSVTLRGPKALIDAIDPTKITATLDVSEAKLGELIGGKPVLKLGAGFEAVGVLNVDSIQIMYRLVDPSKEG
jgi:YbbR domain-containing protein